MVDNALVMSKKPLLRLH